jgi:sugar phosphate isomerase/epimerase
MPIPPISVNQVCTRSWSFEQDVAFLQAEGLDTISLHMPKLEAVGVARAESLLAGAGLRVALINSTGFFALADEDALSGQVARTLLHIEWAARLDASALLLVAGAAVGRPWEEQRDLFRHVLERVLPEAERHGVRLGVEHHNTLRPELSFINTLDGALDLVEEVGSPHLGVVMEVNNAWIERGLYDNLRRRHKWLAIVQVNDFRLGTTCTNQRVPIGDGVIPLRPIVHTLHAAGYRGFYDIELLGPVIEELGYAEAIRRSVAAFSSLWA